MSRRQFGSIAITRAFAVPSPAAPALGPGGTFVGTLAAHDRRLVEAAVTLEQEAAAAQLAAIHQAAASQPELLALSFTDAAQRSQTYDIYQQAIAARPTMELVYLGVALAGSRRQVNALTGSLPLLRL